MGFSPAGGNISGADDVALSNPATGHLLTFNGTTQMWQNMAASGGGSADAFLVASSTAPQSVKNNAAYTATGSDDQTTIQSALDALPSTGGRVVCWGVFSLSAPIRIEKHGVMLQGVGTGSRTNASQVAAGTKFVAAAGFVGTEVLRVQSAANDAPLSNVTLEHFTVDGATVGSGIDGILFRSHTATIGHVHVHRATGNGIRVKGYVNGVDGFTGVTWATYDTTIERCIVSNSGGSGVFFDTGAQDDHLIGSVIFDNLNGIRIKAASQQITNCHTYSSADYNVWFDGSGSRTKIVNLKCEQAGKHGIYLDGTSAGTSDVMIVGCGFKNNGMSVHNTYSHVMIDGLTANAHSRTAIVGNNFSKTTQFPNIAAYGINLATSAAQHTNIQTNSFGDDHFATGPVNNGSSSTNAPLIQNNRGYSSALDAKVLVGGAAGNATVWFGGATQPAGMSAGQYWIHEA